MTAHRSLAIVPETPGSEGSSALSPDPAGLVVVRFRIHAGESGLEALRHARRSMLREDWTIGRRDEEPSLEDAVFSNDAIVWPVWAEQRKMCLAKIVELEARVERTFAELAATASSGAEAPRHTRAEAPAD
jgi:hypothetical protein